MVRLTAKSIEKIKPGAGRREIPDGLTPGLYLVVQSTGTKSWALRYRNRAGRTRKLTLGPLGGLALADAREKARNALKLIERGKDPAQDKHDALIEAPLRTFGAVAENFIERYAKERNRSWKQYESALNRHVTPRWKDTDIAEIRRRDVAHLLDGIADKSGPVSADFTLRVLRKLFRWHATRDDEFVPPVVAGMARTKPGERARARVLDDAELRALWAHWTKDDDLFGDLCRFLLLTGARRNEAARMTRAELVEAEIDGRSVTVWTVPAGRSKTKREHVLPLSSTALEIINGRPKIGATLLFTTNGVAPFSNFTFAKTAVEKATGVSGWTLHDLRRTARSLMARAGVPADHAERVLGHVQPGIVGVYDRHGYAREKLRAVEALSAEITRVVSGKPADVVPLRRK